MHPQPLRQLQNTDRSLFVLAVCTRGRQSMLQNCMDCLVKLKTPDDWELEIVIVENDPQPLVNDLVKDYASKSEYKITYRHEPDIGIPQARNHALNYALSAGAEFIGFIDDDECIPSDWLRGMKNAFEYYDCDVVQAPVDFIYEKNAPFWLTDTRKKDRPSGQLMRTAATDNVAFHRRLIAPFPEGLGLRFNSDMRFSGGSDTDFFFRATDAGAKIVWTNNAVVYETVMENRITAKWQLQRTYRKEANASLIYLKRKGTLKAVLKYGPKIFKRLFFSVCYLIAFIFARFFNEKAAISYIIKAGRKAMSAYGACQGLLGIKPRVYQKIDNH